MNLDGYITVHQAIRKFGLTDRRWQQLAKNGDVRAIKTGNLWWLHEEDCKEHIRSVKKK